MMLLVWGCTLRRRWWWWYNWFIRSLELLKFFPMGFSTNWIHLGNLLGILIFCSQEHSKELSPYTGNWLPEPQRKKWRWMVQTVHSARHLDVPVLSLQDFVRRFRCHRHSWNTSKMIISHIYITYVCIYYYLYIVYIYILCVYIYINYVCVYIYYLYILCIYIYYVYIIFI